MVPNLWCGVKSKSNKSRVERKEVLRKEEKIIKKKGREKVRAEAC